MTLNVKCYILRTNRTVKIINRDIKKGLFRFNNGIYLMPKADVNLTDDAIPELIYYENDPLPMTIHEDREKKSKEFLNQIVISKAMEELGQPSSMFMEIIAGYIKSPPKMLMLIFLIIIILALINAGMGMI